MVGFPIPYRSLNDNPTKCLPEGNLPSGRQITSHLREKVSKNAEM